jgi:hypothetical protein
MYSTEETWACPSRRWTTTSGSLVVLASRLACVPAGRQRASGRQISDLSPRRLPDLAGVLENQNGCLRVRAGVSRSAGRTQRRWVSRNTVAPGTPAGPYAWLGPRRYAQGDAGRDDGQRFVLPRSAVERKLDDVRWPGVCPPLMGRTACSHKVPSPRVGSLQQVELAVDVRGCNRGVPPSEPSLRAF